MKKLLKQKELLENKLEECKNSTNGILISLLFKSMYQEEYDEIINKLNSLNCLK